MRVLVVGGSGYIGSHTVRELVASGHEVVLYDNLSTGFAELSRGFKLVVGEIADTVKLAGVLAEVDAVIHFAASAYVGESVANPRKYFRNNVEDALQLLDAVLASRVRLFVFSSTCATYGVPRELPITEECPQDPVNPYGATKLFLEHVLAAYATSHGLQYAALRYFNAAGAHPSGEIGEMHEPETHLIPLALKAALGTMPPLRVFGHELDTPDGTCVRDFIHVTDLGRAHVMALEYLSQNEGCLKLNLGTGRGTSIRELLTVIEQVTGSKVPHVFEDARAGDPPVLYADPSKAKAVLGWQAEAGLEQIVGSAWKWEKKLSERE